MSRLDNPVAYGRMIGIALPAVTRIPSERLRGGALARNNGRVAAECEVPMPRANPYRKGSRNWREFNAGYQWTALKGSAVSGEPDQGGPPPSP